MTPLLFAFSRGHYKIVKYLLDHGANPDVEDIKLCFWFI